MKVIRLNGYWYCHALPRLAVAFASDAGAFVAAALDDTHILADEGRLDAPEGSGGVLFVRRSPDGRRRFCGQAHESTPRDQALLWTVADGWRFRGHAPGTNPCIFNRDGELLIANPSETGSQGYRCLDDAGNPIPVDLTLEPNRPLSRAAGIQHLWEATPKGDIWIGQGGDEEGCQALVGSERRRVLIEAGVCRRIEFEREGSQLAIAFYKPTERVAVLIWMTVAELQAFATYTIPGPTQPPVDKPKEPPVPENIDRFLVDRSDVVVAVKRDYPHLRGGEIVDQAIHRLNRLYQTDRFGRKARQADGGNPNDDVVTFRLDDADFGKKKLIDVLGDGGGADVPMWNVRPAHEEPGNGFWSPAVNPDLDGAVPGDRPPPPSGGSIDAIVQKLIAAATAPLKAEIERLGAMVAALESRPVASFPERIALRSDHGKFVVAEPDGTVAANRDVAGAWETFSVVLK